MRLEAGYSRDAATAEAASILDSVWAYLNWRPTGKIRVNARATWSQREVAGDLSTFETIIRPATVRGISDIAEIVSIDPVDSESNRTLNETFLITLEGRYLFTPEVAGFVRFSWRRQEIENRRRSIPDTDRFRVFIGFTYTYGPIRPAHLTQA